MTRTLQRKVLSTATALAVAAGAVVLFRLGVQRLVLGSGDRAADFAVAPLALVPAPREFDLGRLIPAALDFYVAGLSFSERGEELAMPAALAEEISRNEAEAAGWKLQRNKVTGHARIIDPQRVRKAWGRVEDMTRSFEKIKSKLM